MARRAKNKGEYEKENKLKEKQLLLNPVEKLYLIK